MLTGGCGLPPGRCVLIGGCFVPGTVGIVTPGGFGFTCGAGAGAGVAPRLFTPIDTEYVWNVITEVFGVGEFAS